MFTEQHTDQYWLSIQVMDTDHTTEKWNSSSGMKYLRHVTRLTKRDRFKNEQVRTDLRVQPILEVIKQRQLNWWRHLQWTSENRPSKRLWEAKIRKKSKDEDLFGIGQHSRKTEEGKDME